MKWKSGIIRNPGKFRTKYLFCTQSLEFLITKKKTNPLYDKSTKGTICACYLPKICFDFKKKCTAFNVKVIKIILNMNILDTMN